MFYKLRSYIDPTILIGVSISVLMSLLLLLIGVDTLLSFIVALLMVVISLLIDVIRRQSDGKKEIIDALHGVMVKIIPSEKHLSDIKYQLLVRTQNIVCDTELCIQSGFHKKEESDFRKLLHERISNNEITYKFVQVIYDRSQFEQLLEWLFKYHEHHYYIGYFLAPPEVIPTLNLMIFDNKEFLLGGYYGPSARGDDRNLSIQHELMASTFEQYFEYLWSKARLFNENGAMNWLEIFKCGFSLGYTKEELNQLIQTTGHNVGYTGVHLAE